MAATDRVLNPLDRLALDANGDGQLALADLFEWLSAAFFLPGDGLLLSLATHAAPLAQLLGIGTADYGGVLSALVSICVWFVAFMSANIAYHFVLDVDRRVTRATKRLVWTATLRVRLARARLLQRWRAWRAARTPANRADAATDVDLSAQQLAALRLHAELSAGYASSVSEVAHALGARSRTTEDLLDGLHELGLLRRTLGGADGESAYTLTAAGRALLLFRQLTPKRHG